MFPKSSEYFRRFCKISFPACPGFVGLKTSAVTAPTKGSTTENPRQPFSQTCRSVSLVSDNTLLSLSIDPPCAYPVTLDSGCASEMNTEQEFTKLPVTIHRRIGDSSRIALWRGAQLNVFCEMKRFTADRGTLSPAIGATRILYRDGDSPSGPNLLSEIHMY